MGLWGGKKNKFSLEKDRGTCFWKGEGSDGANTQQVVFQWWSKVWTNSELYSLLPVVVGVLCHFSVFSTLPLLSSANFYVTFEETTFSLLQRGFLFLWLQMKSHTQTVLSHILSQEHRTPFQTPPKLSLVILPTAFVNDKELSWAHSTKQDKLESWMVCGRKYIKLQNGVYHTYFDLLSHFKKYSKTSHKDYYLQKKSFC